MFKWICALGGLLALSAAPALGVISNGFDSDQIYVLTYAGDPVYKDNPSDVLFSHSKLTPVSDNWTEVGPIPAPQDNTATSGTFYGHQFTSLAFSYSLTPGNNTPAGYRLFCLGRERAPDFDTYRPILVEVGFRGNPPVLKELREVYIGKIVSTNKNFGLTDWDVIINWPYCNLRYNPQNNTLMVAMAIGSSFPNLHGYIYEFTLPDSPEGTGVGSPNETQGCTLMETYDTGLLGEDARCEDAGISINVSPAGALYFRNQCVDMRTFSSTAGGKIPGGTTSGPTVVVTRATLNGATQQPLVGTSGQWQSMVYRPVSNSLVNLQKKTASSSPFPVMVDYDLDITPPSAAATLISGSTGYRGQVNGSLDVATGDVWVGSRSWPSEGGLWKYTAGGQLISWDNLGSGGKMVYDTAVAPPLPGACCVCTPGVIGCTCIPSTPQNECVDVYHGTYKGDNTTCDQEVCCPDLFADADGDGDVDQIDFAAFQACFSGSTAAVTGNCKCFDVANSAGARTPDTFVDQNDLDEFELCASGSGVPLHPACAD